MSLARLIIALYMLLQLQKLLVTRDKKYYDVSKHSQEKRNRQKERDNNIITEKFRSFKPAMIEGFQGDLLGYKRVFVRICFCGLA